MSSRSVMREVGREVADPSLTTGRSTVFTLLFMSWLGAYTFWALQDALKDSGTWWKWALIGLYAALITLNVVMYVRMQRWDRRLYVSATTLLAQVADTFLEQDERRIEQLEMVLLQHGIDVPDAH